jgi:hypothetical protein
VVRIDPRHAPAALSARVAKCDQNVAPIAAEDFGAMLNHNISKMKRIVTGTGLKPGT